MLYSGLVIVASNVDEEHYLVNYIQRLCMLSRFTFKFIIQSFYNLCFRVRNCQPSMFITTRLTNNPSTQIERVIYI